MVRGYPSYDLGTLSQPLPGCMSSVRCCRRYSIAVADQPSLWLYLIIVQVANFKETLLEACLPSEIGCRIGNPGMSFTLPIGQSPDLVNSIPGGLRLEIMVLRDRSYR